MIGRVLLTRWTRAGFGSQLNWHGRLLNRVIPRAITRASVEVSGAPSITCPDMIDDSRLSFKVARGIVPGSLTNGRRVATEINEVNPGSNLRIPTEEELLELNSVLGNQLEGTDYWIWTETEHERYPGQFVLRHLGDGNRIYRLHIGYYSGAVRFVEDK